MPKRATQPVVRRCMWHSRDGGPVEASTLGNIVIQLMTLDELSNVDDFRRVVSANYDLTTYILILIVKLPPRCAVSTQTTNKGFAHGHSTGTSTGTGKTTFRHR